MRLIQIVIQNMLLFYFVVTYIGICVGLFITEGLLLKKSRHRTTIIFLLITGLFSLVCFCIYPAEQMISNYDLVKAPVKINEKVAGMQLAVIERETDGRGKTLKYLGEFITDEGSASQYFNVNLENGKVRCEDFPACEEAIQETFSERKISIANFNGNSLTYQELIEEMNGAGVNEKSTFKASAIKFAVVFLPETVLIMKYILFEFQRKRKNMLKKMKLADL